MTDLANQIELRSAIRRRADRGLEIAASFLQQLDRRGSLSPKQTAIAEQWLAEDRGDAPRRQPQPDTPGPLAPIHALFAKALESNKRPALHFSGIGSSKVEVKIKPASAKGRNAGWLYLHVAGQYVGKISPSGTATIYSIAEKPEVERFLAELAEDPTGVAQEYGRESGRCCFCGRELTDPASVEVGYGPVCASKWGMPYERRSRKSATPQPQPTAEPETTEDPQPQPQPTAVDPWIEDGFVLRRIRA